MKIKVVGQNSQFIKLEIGYKQFNVRLGDQIDLCTGEIIKTCKFCGREYTKQIYEETFMAQAPRRFNDPNFNLGFISSKCCGPWCSWLKEPSMVNTIIRMEGNEKLEVMKDDIASRVAKFISDRKDEKN